MEYGAELYNYYRDSYGFDFAQKLPCRVVNDLIAQMDDPSAANKVIAYFSHSTILLMLLSAFGTFYDSTPLRADNFRQQANRQFRVSKISPYASSMAAVKYKCPADMIGEKILFLLNQKPLAMTWCKEGAVCTINEIRNMMAKSPMKSCRSDMCKVKKVHKKKVHGKNVHKKRAYQNKVHKKRAHTRKHKSYNIEYFYPKSSYR